jgi:heme/copper-type cytochrome/quinol oxidase subunit 2
VRGNLKSNKVLNLCFLNNAKYATKVVAPTTGITILQKKIEKTAFNSKLSNKQYSEKTNLVYVIGHDNVVKRVPDYTESHQDSFRNKNISTALYTKLNQLDKSYPYQKRLLWVNKVLLLPTHMAITIVTNSYDVIHSWFIPGLGLKLDCVPGRSTHHTIYIEYGGYYYGQCAEVCGRRHHHMPIKIRAIPYMIFAYW